MRSVKKTICPLDCPDSCGMLATVEAGRVTALTGDPDHPYTGGFICRKMRGYPERLYSRHRVLYPQVRTGPKGAGSFRRISWDEAWERLVSRLQDILRHHGGEAVLPFSYAGNMGVVNRFAGFPLFHRMGASRSALTICSAAAAGGWKMGCGDVGGTPPERAAAADLIIAWGINIRVSNVHFWRFVRRARKAGARLLVIDPYCNETGRCADELIRVRPGGDGALALGVLKILVEEDAVDHRFIAAETEGFERLAGYVRKTALARFEAESGVSRPEMERLAATLASRPKTFIRIGVGLTRNRRGGMAVRAISSLAAALGLFDGMPGRGVLLFAGAFDGERSRLTFPELAAGETRIINMVHLGQALTAADPAVRALIVYNANPVSVVPDGSAVRAGLRREDLFTVVHEQVMSPTARFADLLLPATTFLENRDLYTAYGHFHLGIADPVIEPLGEALSNFDFFQTLALKMGYDEAPFRQRLDERLTSYLATLSGLPDGFRAADCRAGTYLASVRAAASGSPFARAGRRFRFVNDDDPAVPPFACLTESAEFDHPDLVSRFPYKLIIPPNDKLLNSTFGERYGMEPGGVLIHPADAARERIVDGETVWLCNFRGRAGRKAVITEDSQPGLLVAEGLYWPVAGTETGINDLVSQACTDIGAGPLFHESRVRLETGSGNCRDKGPAPG